MDPLSDVLSILRPRSYMAGGFDVGGDLSIRFERHEGLKCYAVSRGECWLAVDGMEAIRLKTGDCFLLTQGKPFRLASDLALEPTDALALLAGGKREGGVTVVNGGGFCILGGFFKFTGGHAESLLGALPPVVHLEKESDKDAMRWALERMRIEMLEQQPGGSLVADHLAHMMLVQALRLHLAEGACGRVGWLFALADKQIGAAIAAMHEAPGQRWSLPELAERAGMSRSIFALKFKERVGSAPMEYLTRWRMHVAADRLSMSDDTLAGISASLGYESESAFSAAFKRVMGVSPRQYARRSEPERV